MRLPFISSLLSLLLLLSACNDAKKETVKPDLASIIYKKDTSVKKIIQDAPKPPIINIVDTLAIKRIVILVKDSARSSERIGIKMASIYDSILPAFLKKNKIKKTGPHIAFYKTSKAPFIFEAGFQIDKKPAKTSKNIKVVNIGGDSAIVVHYYGPYESTYQAYAALNEWMRDRKKRLSSAPYEIYMDDPFDENGKKKDPYKVLTDIVFPHR